MTSLPHDPRFPLLASDDDCMGCAACINVCPHDAISMPWNEEGFHTPIVDLEICTHCNACTKICPPLQKEHERSRSFLNEPDVYGGWHLDNHIRLSSSSGGIFTALAEQIINEGGCVFGAAQNTDLTLSHICIETKDDLQKLRGSKYFQSDIGQSFRNVRQLLKQKRPVLFSGTPCQIAGLLSYMRKPHPLLITCDLACHGSPSYRLFQSYADYHSRKISSRLSGINFRSKEHGWMQYSLKRYFQSGEETSTLCGEDLFMRGFLSDICLGKACYGCPWNAFPRQADITLADYWGVQEVHPDWETEKGVSIIFANSEEGRALLKKVRSKLYLFQETMATLPEGSLWNQGLSSIPIQMPLRRERFLHDLSHMDLPTALDTHLAGRSVKYDVGIVGMWMTCNYGALLTTFALYRLIESMKLDPILIDHAPMMHIPRFSEQDNIFRRFIQDCGMRTTSPLEHRGDFDQLNDRIDTFLVGSDQVWRHEYASSCGHYYFLDFVHGNKRKIAFGSSFGQEQDTAPDSFRTLAACYLQKFDAVAVREANAIDILHDTYGIDASTVLDPVFLCDKRLYFDLISHSSRQENDDFILSYILDPTEYKRQILIHASDHEQTKLVNMVDAQADAEANKKRLNLEHTIDHLSVEDWLFYVSRCRMLITDSFHGVCFALIFNKPFVCIANRERGLPRFTSLLEQMGLMSHLIFPNDSLDTFDAVPRQINYAEVNTILEKKRTQSCDWLSQALSKERSTSRLIPDFLIDQLIQCNTTITENANEAHHHICTLEHHVESLRHQMQQITHKHHQDIQNLCAHMQQELNQQTIKNTKIQHLSHYQRQYRYCRFMSKITFGKKRAHYQQKKRNYKRILEDIKIQISTKVTD